MGYKRKKETQRRQVARWREKHRKEYNEVPKEYKRLERVSIPTEEEIKRISKLAEVER